MAVIVKEGYEASARTYGRHVSDESVALTTTFQNVLLIDSRRVRQTPIVFNNTGGTNALNYQIFGASRYSPDVLKYIKTPTNAAVDKDNDEWVNLLSIISGETGTTYTHTFSKALSAGNRFYESFSNEWSMLLITAQSALATTTMKIWSRGQS